MVIKEQEMLRRSMILTIFVLFLNLVLSPSVWASGNTEKGIKLAEKVKTNISKLGTGANARIKLKLKDGTKIKGYISEVSEDSLVVQNEKTGLSERIAYTSVKQVKGNNLSTGVKIAIGVGIFILVIVIAATSLS